MTQDDSIHKSKNNNKKSVLLNEKGWGGLRQTSHASSYNIFKLNRVFTTHSLNWITKKKSTQFVKQTYDPTKLGKANQEENEIKK